MPSKAQSEADGPDGLTNSDWGKTTRDELASPIIEQHKRQIEAHYKVWEDVQREMLPDDVAAEVVRLMGELEDTLAALRVYVHDIKPDGYATTMWKCRY